MTERIVTDANGHNHITTEPMLHQPKREWVGLTKEEAADCWSTEAVRTWHAIETKLKEKNT